jgi:hypothetical protein
MFVIMDYDMADNGRYKPDRKREDQERRTRDTEPSQKNIQTTKKPPAETSVTSATSCQHVGWNRNMKSMTLLLVYYCGPYESQSFIHLGKKFLGTLGNARMLSL